MAIQSRGERILYQGVIPIMGAVLGAVAATWFQAASVDQAQLGGVVALLKDAGLTPQQKLQALEIYREITDRPWAIVRSLVGYAGFALASAIGALTVGGYFRRP